MQNIIEKLYELESKAEVNNVFQENAIEYLRNNANYMYLCSIYADLMHCSWKYISKLPVKGTISN